MNKEYSRIIDIISKSGKHNDGRNITVAVFDTGIHPHIDIMDRIVGFYDSIYENTEAYDDNGHGTHIAGIIAGNGYSSKGKFRGIAVESNILGVKVLDSSGKGKLDNLLKGIYYVIANKERYNIMVANFSVGAIVSENPTENEVFLKAMKLLRDYGIIAVAAAGNYGPAMNSITLPGISDDVITVGSSDDNVPVKVGFAKKMLVNYSGRSCESCHKPDISAPGSHIYSCSNIKNHYVQKSGTSMASAVISGIVAIYLAKNPDVDVDLMKNILCSECIDIGRERYVQGCGEVNIEAILTLL